MTIRLLSLFAALLLSGSSVAAPTDSSETERGGEYGPEQSQLNAYHEAYYQLDTLNAGVRPATDAPPLQTPQAALEYFTRACRNERFAEAAQVLNLNLIPETNQALAGPQLARRLHYVIGQRLRIDWESVSDRPDGISEGASSRDPLAGQPRRSVRLGSIPLSGRDAIVRLQRVRVGDQPPVWVFAASTIENVDALYDAYGPGWLSRHVPAWARVSFLGEGVWQWGVLLILIGLATGLFFGLKWTISSLSGWFEGRLLRRASRAGAVPLALALSLITFDVAAPKLISLDHPFARAFYSLLLLVIIGVLTWLAMRVIGVLSDHFAKDRIDGDLKEIDPNEQKALTIISVARRAVIFTVLVAGVGIVISRFEPFKTVGFSALAFSGVLSIVLGIAAQATLGNIIAGLQIAITRPVRIGDNVLFEGNWGWVEDITYTYLTILTWDQRRLVVPLKYFITHPVENWTVKDPHLVKPIYLYADYRIDVQQVREKFGVLLRQDNDWDERSEPTVQVTAVKEETLEIRALCSAKTPAKAWELHCRLRESMVAFIAQLEDGQYLTQRRVQLREGARASRPMAHQSANGSDTSS